MFCTLTKSNQKTFLICFIAADEIQTRVDFFISLLCKLLLILFFIYRKKNWLNIPFEVFQCSLYVNSDLIYRDQCKIKS